MTVLLAVRRVGMLAALAFFAAAFVGCKPGEKPDMQPQTTEETPKTPADSTKKHPEAAKPPVKKTALKESKPSEGKPADETGRFHPSQVSEGPMTPKDITASLPYKVTPFNPKKPLDWGKPLVENPDALVRLDKKEPVWFDKKNRQVVLQGSVCASTTPLEFFATYANRAYEAVLTVNVKPSTVHAALVLAGAEPGHPSQFKPPVPPQTDPEFIPPTGTEVAIEVRWKDQKGRVFSAPAQYWIRNVKTKKELDCNWVFAGSGWYTDEETGKKYYQADSGELICLLSLPNAMLDLPRLGYGALEARTYEAFKEHLPIDDTPTTVLLKPILKKKAGVPKLSADELPDAKLRAVAAAEAWLALLDRKEYLQCWEDASGHLKGAVDRHEFIKKVGGLLESLGKAASRTLKSQEYATELPAMPDGHYFVLQYKTAFAKKASATETITVTRSKDKKWRVIGYYVN